MRRHAELEPVDGCHQIGHEPDIRGWVRNLTLVLEQVERAGNRPRKPRRPRHTDTLSGPEQDHHPQSHSNHPASTKPGPDYPHILTNACRCLNTDRAVVTA